MLEKDYSAIKKQVNSFITISPNLNNSLIFIDLMIVYSLNRYDK